MPRPAPEWKPRNPVEAVAHEPEPSGLLEAWEAVPLVVNEGEMMCRHGLSYPRCDECGEVPANYAGEGVG